MLQCFFLEHVAITWSFLVGASKLKQLSREDSRDASRKEGKGLKENDIIFGHPHQIASFLQPRKRGQKRKNEGREEVYIILLFVRLYG